MKSIKQHVLDLLESDVIDINEIARRSCLDPQQVINALRNLQQQNNIHMIVQSKNAQLL